MNSPDKELLVPHRSLGDRLLGKGVPDKAVDAIMHNGEARASADASEPVRWGRWALLAAGLLFVAWGAFAPLSQGVPINGFLKVEGNSKSIQHMKGGIVEEIACQDEQIQSREKFRRNADRMQRVHVGTDQLVEMKVRDNENQHLVRVCCHLELLGLLLIST